MDPHIRDQQLLDALESAAREPYEGIVWRSVKEGRDPLICWRSGGRWDDGTFDVLYTSETRAAAIAERRFHLYQGQPIPPFDINYELFELSVSLSAVIRFADMKALAAVGLDAAANRHVTYVKRYGEYARSQQVAEASAFLGADGILVPSARHKGSMNLIVFCEQDTEIRKSIVRSHGVIDFSRDVATGRVTTGSSPRVKTPPIVQAAGSPVSHPAASRMRKFPCMRRAFSSPMYLLCSRRIRVALRPSPSCCAAATRFLRVSNTGARDNHQSSVSTVQQQAKPRISVRHSPTSDPSFFPSSLCSTPASTHPNRLLPPGTYSME